MKMTERLSSDEDTRTATPEEAVDRAPGFPVHAALQRRIQRRAAQRRSDDEQAQDAAAFGTRGAATALPHGDTIQRAFGRHDVSGIAAHVDADAAAGASAMGAEAFATGHDVAFAGAPSLHTAAHEAAHVVQQRGGVQLAGGVGAEGDPYERHADAVADRVVAGGSAEAILDQHAGAATAAPAVQRKITVGKEQLRYDNEHIALAALRSTFSDAREDVLLYHLKQLSDVDTGFQNFVSLKHDVNRRLGTQVDEGDVGSVRMDKTDQHYGTDVSISTSKEDAIENFKAALKAGFRSFDTATFYTMGLGDCSLIALVEAAKSVGVGPDELNVLYKVMPPDGDRVNDSIEDQIETAAETLSQYPNTLVLHEVTDLEEGKTDLGKLIALVKKKKVKRVGVSNVSLPFLEPLYAYSVEQGVPISVVQNRFNPYHQDTELRKFCDQRGIQYLGYSVLGSAQKGVCHEDGQGDPRQYLVPLQDPRVLDLAKKHGISAGAMLLSWAHQKGVSAVTFTTSGQERDEQNLAAGATPLPLAVMDEVDALMTVPPSPSSRDFGDKQGLAKLYAAVLDPSAWFIMDELCKAGAGGLLIDGLANQIVKAFPEAREQRDQLLNFGLNLVRFAADLQSPANKRKESWLEVAKEQFAALAKAAGGDDDKVRDLCVEWSRKNADQGGHAQNAMQDFQEIMSGEYKPTRPVTDTGRENSKPPVEIDVPVPKEGDVLTLTPANTNAAPIMKGYDITAFDAMVQDGVYSVYYLGKFGLDVTVTAVASGSVTVKVNPED